MPIMFATITAAEAIAAAEALALAEAAAVAEAAAIAEAAAVAETAQIAQAAATAEAAAAAQQTAQAGIASIPDPNFVASVTAPPPPAAAPVPAAPAAPAAPPAPASAPEQLSRGLADPTLTSRGSLINGQFTNTTLGAPTDLSNAAMRSGMDPAFLNGPTPSNTTILSGVDPSIASGPAPTDAMMRGFTPVPGMSTTTSLGPFNPPPSALEDGFTKAMDWADKNPFKASAIAYTGANALGLLDPSNSTFNQEKYDGPLTKYKLSPNFQAGSANPANFQYKPRYAVGGGIMGTAPYDIPVGYDEGGPVALPLPSRTVRDSNAFQVPGQPQNPSQFAAADAYNDILRNRVVADTQSGRANDPMYRVTDARQLETRANTPERGFGPTIAGNELRKRSDEGEYAVPGFGDLGQFAGSSDNGGMGGGRSGFDEMGRANMAMAKGGSLSESIEQYQKMLDGKPQAAPAVSRDVGIYYDQDPDTRYQDALTAAQIRQAKVNKRANVDLPAVKRPTPMGQLNLRPLGAKTEASGSSLDPENAASGGIMHSSLGGYAAGGNPRLLRGPGDGMSDNIPATISGRQPARLADGEFVIPADVVSHLGNGSTEAGAKQLHAMMDRVRKARTGNSKQGKNIKPQKYMPK